MRLNLVISSLDAGGAERVMGTLADAWAERGHVVDLFTTHDAGREPHYRLSPQVRRLSVDPRASGPWKQAAVVRSLRRAIRESRPDAVVSFLNYTNILTLAACRGLTCPVIVSERLDPRIIEIGPVWSLLRRLSYRRAARLVAQTPTAAALFEHLAPGRVRVIPNPVLVQTGAADGPAPLPAAEGPTILCVGRLYRQKGFDLALRAMALLPPACDAWRLVILGEGPERPALESLRGELGLGERVQLPGQVPDPRPWLRRAGIFLMSSRSEGFPNALCEAMAAGLPVVSTDCPSGPADIVTPGVDGLLVPPEDPPAMAAALARLIADGSFRARLAQAAPAVADRYSLDTVMTSWAALLAGVTGVAAPSDGCPPGSRTI